MNRIFITLVLLSAFTISSYPAFATQLWLDPDEQSYDVGDTITIELYADIDEEDAIFGFGFDLSFDDGVTYVSGTGESGDYLTFTDFTVNGTYFQYDDMFPPLWEDGDTISGEVPWGELDVWGTDILLGTLYFEAPSSGDIGTETIYIGPLAGDYGIFGEEGLIGSTALMPNNPTATVSPVPEPATLLLLGSGLMGLAGFRGGFKRKFRKIR